jgi:hypothetical protein
MLPVRSAKLTPGTVARRVIEAPGLRPVPGHRRRRGFAGLACSGAPRFARARRGRPGGQRRDRRRAWHGCAPGARRAPRAASGDDLAERLGLRHYPALITATGIEQ